MHGTPLLGVVKAIKLGSYDNLARNRNMQDELKVGDQVLIGEEENQLILVDGEEYYLTYRNRLVKVNEKNGR